MIIIPIVFVVSAVRKSDRNWLVKSKNIENVKHAKKSFGIKLLIFLSK